MMLECKELYTNYAKKEILHGISFQAKRGELVCVVGPNGCGKTTLLRSVLGIVPVRSGEVLLDGVSLLRRSRTDIARSLAYVSQNREIPPLSVYEAVLQGRFAHLRYPRIYGERDREIAREVMRSLGLCELRDTPLRELSGGMRRIVHIATALAAKTDYILLDEPTSSLDISNRLHLMRTLRSLAEGGKGIVCVLHDLPLALDFADRLAVMKDGRLLAFDRTDEIYKCGVLRDAFGVELCRIQSGEHCAYYYKE